HCHLKRNNCACVYAKAVGVIRWIEFLPKLDSLYIIRINQNVRITQPFRYLFIPFALLCLNARYISFGHRSLMGVARKLHHDFCWSTKAVDDVIHQLPDLIESYMNAGVGDLAIAHLRFVLRVSTACTR